MAPGLATVNGPPCDVEQKCLGCGLARMPRYKTDKSWARHRQFCGLPLSMDAAQSHGERLESATETKADGSFAAGLKVELEAPNLSARATRGFRQLLDGLRTDLQGYQFTKVLLGVTNGEQATETPAKQARHNEDHFAKSEDESARLELSERLRREFIELYPHVEVVSQTPDLSILLDISQWRLQAIPSSIFLYGRYRKLVRDIPQTRWPCTVCRADKSSRYGKRKSTVEAARFGALACEACKGTGLQYRDSVQDLVGKAVVLAFKADDCVFHGMGREDIDVRCLGSGRPFVLELKAPKLRSPLGELEALVRSVNLEAAERVELYGPLRASNRGEVARIKDAHAEKTYTICFRVEGGFQGTKDELAILALEGATLDQRTPARVKHRRADLIRDRTICKLGPLIVKEDDQVELTIRAQSGTYIKEFVHSDEGRTTPSVAAALGRKCVVLWLDVIEIHSE